MPCTAKILNVDELIFLRKCRNCSLGICENFGFFVCCYALYFIYRNVIWCFHSFSFSLQGVSSLRALILNVSCKVFFSPSRRGRIVWRWLRDGYNCVKKQTIHQNSYRLGVEEEGNGGLMKGEIWGDWSPTLITNSCWFFFFFLFKVNKYKTLGLLIRWELHYFVSETKAHIIFSCKRVWFHFTKLIGRYDLKNDHLEMYFFKGSDKKGAESAPTLNKIQYI